MADYMMPNEAKMTINDQRNIFAMRNRMVLIPSNFSENNLKEVCVCGHEANMKHLYICEYWNDGNILEKIPYDKIFSDNVSEQLKISKQFFKNLEEREKIQNEKNEEQNMQPHAIHFSDPLSSLSIVMDHK